MECLNFIFVNTVRRFIFVNAAHTKNQLALTGLNSSLHFVSIKEREREREREMGDEASLSLVEEGLNY